MATTNAANAANAANAVPQNNTLVDIDNFTKAAVNLQNTVRSIFDKESTQKEKNKEVWEVFMNGMLELNGGDDSFLTDEEMQNWSNMTGKAKIRTSPNPVCVSRKQTLAKVIFTNILQKVVGDIIRSQMPERVPISVIAANLADVAVAAAASNRAASAASTDPAVAANLAAANLAAAVSVELAETILEAEIAEWLVVNSGNAQSTSTTS